MHFSYDRQNWWCLSSRKKQSLHWFSRLEVNVVSPCKFDFIISPTSFTEHFSAIWTPSNWSLAISFLLLFNLPGRSVELEHFSRLKSRQLCIKTAIRCICSALHSYRADISSCNLVKIKERITFTLRFMDQFETICKRSAVEEKTLSDRALK